MLRLTGLCSDSTFTADMLRSSIIIPVFNKATLTAQCLRALFKRSGGDYEVIVVNDASTDGTAELLAEYGGKIRVVTHGSNQGFAKSCNDGAAIAEGHFLIFLNNDTVPQEGWLDKLASYAEKHPRVAAVGAKLLFPDNTIQHAGVVILSQNRYPNHIYTGFPADHPSVNKSRRFQVVTAGCVLIRREAFEWAKGFDPAYQNGYEDVDLCLRLGEKGHEVHYCHESVLYHLESRTRDTKSASQLSNEQLYAKRWADKVHPDDFLYYIQDGLLKVYCRPQYPILIEASPELAINAPWTRSMDSDRMLYNRSGQVYELLQENLRLLVRSQEAEAAMLGHADKAGLAITQRELPVGMNGNGTKGANEAEALKAEIALLKAQHTYDQLRIEELGGTVLELHEKLLQRDTLLMKTRGIDTASIHSHAIEMHSIDAVRELLGYLDKLDAAVDHIYSSRRWTWANPITMLRRLFKSGTARRGYWRIDNALAGYKAWRQRHPTVNS